VIKFRTTFLLFPINFNNHLFAIFLLTKGPLAGCPRGLWDGHDFADQCGREESNHAIERLADPQVE
jgi:hypothetical protein